MKLNDLSPEEGFNTHFLGDSLELVCMLTSAQAFLLLICISYILIETLNGVIQCFNFEDGTVLRFFQCAERKPHTQSEVRKVKSS